MPLVLETVRNSVWSVALSELKIWTFTPQGELELTKQISLGNAKFECLLNFVPSPVAFSGSFSGEIVMWDTNFMEPVQEVVPTTYSIKSLCICNGFLWASTSLRELFVFYSSRLHAPISTDVKMQTNRLQSVTKGKLTHRTEEHTGDSAYEEFVKKLSVPMYTSLKMDPS